MCDCRLRKGRFAKVGAAGVIMAAALLACSGPKIPEGELSEAETAIVGLYHRKTAGVLPDNTEEVSRRLQREGANKEQAESLMSSFREKLAIPETTLDLKKDRTFEIRSGRSVTTGKWTCQNSVVILAPEIKEPKKLQLQPDTDQLKLAPDGSLVDLEGGAPYLRDAAKVTESASKVDYGHEAPGLSGQADAKGAERLSEGH